MDTDGSYTYTIPINVPPGRGGMQPNLALVYSSRAGNGALGVGWSLSGTSSITRCDKVHAAGGVRARVEFRGDDGFCLDGARLVHVAGTQGTAGAEYRTELETFSRIKVTEVASGQPTAWKVEFKDGRIGTYRRLPPPPRSGELAFSWARRTALSAAGGSLTSAEVDLVWPLTRMVDRSGNAVMWHDFVGTSASYTPSTDQLTGVMPLPRFVQYTECDLTPCDYTSGNRRVEFGYETRPITDYIERYISGARQTVGKRLNRISTFIKSSGGTWVKQLEYQLFYELSGATGRSLLNEIKVCDGAGVCGGDTEFAWQNNTAAAHVMRSSSASGFSLSSYLFSSAVMEMVAFDANADGNDDLVFHEWEPVTGTKTERLALADGAGHFKSVSNIAWNAPGCFLGHMAMSMPVDMDNDGQMELLNECGKEGYKVVGWDATANRLVEKNVVGVTGPLPAWQANPGSVAEAAEGMLKFGDLDGDGIPELLVGKTREGGSWAVRKGTSTRQVPETVPQVSWGAEQSTTLPSNGPPDFGSLSRKLVSQVTTVLDENGDGRAELVLMDFESAVRSFSWTNVTTPVFMFRDQLNDRQWTSTTPPGSGQPEWSSPNFSSNAGFTHEGLWYFVDVNGDGLKDALIRGERLPAETPFWFLRINTGEGYTAGIDVGGGAAALNAYGTDLVKNGILGIVGKGYDNGLRIGDMNGDGRDDVVLFDPAGTGGRYDHGYEGQAGRIRVLYSNGYGFNAPVELTGFALGALQLSEGFPAGNPRWPMTTLADIDGNGLMDVVAFIGDFSNRRQLVTLAKDAPGGSDLMISVRNDSIRQQFVQYDNMSAGSVARLANTGVAATEDVHRPALVTGTAYPQVVATRGRVVRRYDADIDGVRKVSENYTYRGGLSSANGRGFLGFQSMDVVDRLTGTRRRYTFDLQPVTTGPNGSYVHYPRIGRPVALDTGPPGTGSGHATDLVDASGTVAEPRSTWTSTYGGHPLRLLSEESIAYADNDGTFISSRGTATTYDIYGSPERVVTTILDAAGASLFTTPPRGFTRLVTTTFANDTASWRLGEPTRVTDAQSANVEANPQQQANPVFTSSSLTTDYRYDSAGRVIWEIRDPFAAANVTTSSTHALKRIFYGSGGVVQGVRNFAPTGAGCASTAACGASAICFQAASGGPNQCYSERRQDFLADASGTVTEGFGNSLGHFTWKLYDPVRMWHYATVEPNGTKTTITRDGFGREREIVSEQGTRTSISYERRLTRRSEAGGGQSATFFDSVGRPEITTWSTFGGGSGIQKVTYDSLGNVISTVYNSSTTAHGTVSATRNSAVAALGMGTATQSAQYDAAGRLATKRDGTSDLDTYSYAGPLGTITVTNNSHGSRSYLTDVLGRVVQMTQTSAAAQASTTTYRYFAGGGLGSIKNPGGITERFRYDAVGRPTGWTTATETGAGEQQRLSVSYDSFDDKRSVTRDGVVATFRYDALGRMIERRSGTEVQSYEWDTTNGIGRRERVTTNTGGGHTTEFTYNALGRLQKRTERYSGGQVLSYGYTYDSFGRLATLRYPEGAGSGDTPAAAQTSRRVGPTVRYNYQNGQLRSISEEDGTNAILWEATERNVMGQVTRSRYGSLSAVSTYGPQDFRLETHSVPQGITSGPPPSMLFGYYTDGTLREKHSTNLSENYEYDGSRRFLRVYHRHHRTANTHDVDATFALGPQGIEGVDTTVSASSTDWPVGDETYTFPASDDRAGYRLSTHRLGTGPTRSYEYDAAGRVRDVREGTTLKRRYDWNSFNLPTQVSNFGPDMTRTFGYDAYGTRVRKTQNASNEVLYAGDLYESRNLNDLSTRESVYFLVADVGVVAELAHPWGQSSTRITRHLFNDNQGSVAYQVVGTTSTQLGFFPFGRRMNVAPTQNFSQRGYTGHRQDDDLGLIDMKGRIYDIATRRFLTRDVVPDQMLTTFGTHAYAYVANNPTNRVDPTGFQAASAPGGNRDTGRTQQEHRMQELIGYQDIGPAANDQGEKYKPTPTPACPQGDVCFPDDPLKGPKRPPAPPPPPPPPPPAAERSGFASGRDAVLGAGAAEFNYRVTATRYAPFDTFGGGWEGDNRTGPDPNGTARVGAHFDVNFGTGRTGEAQPFGHPSAPRGCVMQLVTAALAYDIAASGSRVDDVLPNSENHAQVTSNANGNSITASLDFAGHHGIVPSPDIDSRLELTMNKSNGVLRVTGSMGGDSFPNADATITDSAGTTVTLGNFQTSGGQTTGPYLHLWSTAGTFMTFDVSIPLNPNGTFAR